jgi:hypothetical protein
MIDIETLDLACAIGQDSLHSFMDENLEDCLDFTDLATDDIIIQGLLQASSVGLEKKVDAIIQGSDFSKALHDSFSVLTIEDENPDIISLCMESPQNGDIRSPISQQDTDKRCSHSNCKDLKIHSTSLLATMQKLNECMSRTAKSRSLIVKHRSVQLGKPIKVSSAMYAKTRQVTPVRAKKSVSKYGVDNVVLKKMPLNISKMPLKGYEFKSSGLLRRPNLSGVKRSNCSIADFLRQKKSKSIWCS